MLFDGKKYYLHKSGYYRRDEGRNHQAPRFTVDLHRVKWEKVHGPIPKGCHIHHKDGNPQNNSLSNLECLSNSEHASLHRKKEYQEGRLNYLREGVLRSIATPEGRERYSNGAKKGWEARKYVSKNCRRCNKEFNTLAPQAKWCSKSCGYKEWWRRNKKR